MGIRVHIYTRMTPEEYIQAIRTALSTGDFSAAQQLSIEAVKHYRDNEDITPFPV